MPVVRIRSWPVSGMEISCSSPNRKLQKFILCTPCTHRRRWECKWSWTDLVRAGLRGGMLAPWWDGGGQPEWADELSLRLDLSDQLSTGPCKHWPDLSLHFYSGNSFCNDQDWWPGLVSDAMWGEWQESLHHNTSHWFMKTCSQVWQDVVITDSNKSFSQFWTENTF